jgi:hypothetical protein
LSPTFLVKIQRSVLSVSLEDICSQLKKHGLNIEADVLRRIYRDENELARVERNLWQMLRRIEENRAGMSV